MLPNIGTPGVCFQFYSQCSLFYDGNKPKWNVDCSWHLVQNEHNYTKGFIIDIFDLYIISWANLLVLVSLLLNSEPERAALDIIRVAAVNLVSTSSWAEQNDYSK